jgi:hypothetical protein
VLPKRNTWGNWRIASEEPNATFISPIAVRSLQRKTSGIRAVLYSTRPVHTACSISIALVIGERKGKYIQSWGIRPYACCQSQFLKSHKHVQLRRTLAVGPLRLSENRWRRLRINKVEIGRERLSGGSRGGSRCLLGLGLGWDRYVLSGLGLLLGSVGGSGLALVTVR